MAAAAPPASRPAWTGLAGLACIAGLALAGCTASPEPAPLPPAPGAPGAWAHDLGHDHADPALHPGGTPNLRPVSQVGWTGPLLEAYPRPFFAEMDAQGDLAFVAALYGGFAIVDLADPAAPRTLSHTALPPTYVADIKATADARLVVLGTQGGAVTAAAEAAALAGVPLPLGLLGAAPAPMATTPPRPGLQAWDASDPAAPALVGAAVVETGCHMVSLFEYPQGLHVFCAPNDNTIRVFRAVPVAGAVVFEPVAVWSPGDLSEVLAGKLGPWNFDRFTHDVTVQPDPLTGDPIMLVSFWDLGAWVVDVRDPAAPATLGHWAGEGALLWEGKVHTTVAGVVDGRRVLVTTPEIAAIPAVFVVDATDWGAMRLLGEWTPLPEGYGDLSPLVFSAHNVQLVGNRVYLAQYHGGLWVLDVSDPRAPAPLAHAMPGAAPGSGAFANTFMAEVRPAVWDVVVANGHVLAVDIPSGLHVYALDGDPVGDPGHDSRA